MIRFKFLVIKLFLALSLVFLWSCEKELDRYYETPDWLKGNAWEVLEDAGDYSIFLAAVERAGYRDMISGRGVITVVAPTNEAFRGYLSNKGYSSVNDVPLSELQKTVSFHLVYYSFDKSKFANYRPEGITPDGTQITDAGLNYKFRTKSRPEMAEYLDNTVPENEAQPLRKVYHKERFVPVFSSFLFNTKGIDPQANYEYFYPGKTWTGANGGFNISNASVRDYAIVADNGYVYTVDEVLEPLETIHKVLGQSENFLLFKNMYDRFNDFVYDAALSQNYGRGDSLFLYYHTALPKIASEWSYNGEFGIPDYAYLSELARASNNVFAPTDQSLMDFYTQFWSDYYNSIDEVPFIPIGYLLYNHVYEGDVIFPQEIELGRIRTRFGNAIDFNTNDVSLRRMCANGTLYGLNSLMVPRMFQSVTAPAFQRPQFRMFLHMLNATGMAQPLMTDDINFSVFLPTDNVIEGNTTITGRMIMYQNINPNRFGAQSVLIEGDDVPWVVMNQFTMNALINNHITTRVMSEVGNQKVLKTLNQFQYLLIEDDEKIYSSDIFNNFRDNPATIAKIDDFYNGDTYELVGADDKALIQDYALFKDVIRFNAPAELTNFKLLLEAGGLHTTSPPFSFLQGERFIAFAPTNDAVMAQFGKVPPTPAQIGEFMKYFFVSVNQSGLGDYPFPGAGIEGELTSFRRVGNESTSIKLIDAGDKLQVQDGKGNIFNVVGVFPRIYADGVVYMIDGLMEYQ